MKRFIPNTAAIHATGLALLTGVLFLVTPAIAQSDGGQSLTLAEAKQTRYQIVSATDADGIEAYAAKTLADYLKEMTGAEFPVVSPDEYNADWPAIFVGLSEPALTRLESEPLAKLRDSPSCTVSVINRLPS